MFDLLGPIGAIQSPHGSLEFGNVGVSNCVYLCYKSETAAAVPTLIYSPDELAELIALVELASSEIKLIAPATSLRLGSMRAKPIILRLALVHPPNQEPFLLLRMLQGNWAQDITTPPQALLSLLKMGQVDGPAPIVGSLQRVSGGAWEVGGERLEILQGLSPGQGYYGEYLHPEDVKQGEQVELWPFPVEDKKFVACFRLKNRILQVASAEENQGERSDRLLAQGQNHLARLELDKLAEEQIASGKVLAPWAAKASLTHLLADLADGDDTSAQRLWLGQSQNKFLRMGIDFLEAGQASTHDTLIYHQISAYFHSLNPDIPKAKSAVNGLMSTVCEECFKASPGILAMALCNWYLYLKEICEADPPAEALVEWQKALDSYALKVTPKVISFPSPDTWLIDEDELLSSETLQQSSEGKQVEGSKAGLKKVLIGLALVAVIGLALPSLASLFGSSPSVAASQLEFTGTPALSIQGISLDQTWQEVEQLRNWEERQATILSTYLEDGYLTVRFDADKNLKYIDGPELSRNGQLLLSSGSNKQDIISRWGEPSESVKGVELNYVFDDAGQKCVLTLYFRDESQLERVRLSAAGKRWEGTPSLPILEK